MSKGQIRQGVTSAVGCEHVEALWKRQTAADRNSYGRLAAR